MIYLLLGKNLYLQAHELQKLVRAHNTSPERIDSDRLSLDTLADIVRGGSLFTTKRLVVIRDLSSNTALFDRLTDWASEVSNDTTLVLVEEKLDKRTRAYKTLTKAATLITTELLSEREIPEANEWLRTLAKQYHVRLSTDQRRQMVERALIPGEKPTARVIDQMQLYQAVKALQGAEMVTDDMIATVLPPAITETVFDILEMASRGNIERINHTLAMLQLTEDGYRAVSLIFSQWSQLAMLAMLGNGSSQSAGIIGVHPYVAKKLYGIGRSFSRDDMRALTQLAATLDSDMKTSRVTPWDAIYRFVYAVAAI